MFKYLGGLTLAVFSYFPSSIKVFFYRLMGAKIGENVYFSLGAYVLPFDFDFRKVHIGSNCIMRDNVHISAKNIYLGSDIDIKEDSRIWGQSNFSCGNGSYIDRYVMIDLRRDVAFGKEVCIGAGVYIYTHSAWKSVLTGYPFKFASVTVGDGAWIAAGSFIMPGITIGEGSIVGARSVVLKDVPPDYVFAGNPAIAVRKGVRRSISAEQKNTFVFIMLREFADVFSKDVSVLKSYDGRMDLKITHSRSLFCVPLGKQTFNLVYLRKFKEQVLSSFGNYEGIGIVVSLELSDAARKICDERGFFWIDLLNSSCNIRAPWLYNKISKFLTRYGIVLKNTA